MQETKRQEMERLLSIMNAADNKDPNKLNNMVHEALRQKHQVPLPVMVTKLEEAPMEDDFLRAQIMKFDSISEATGSAFGTAAMESVNKMRQEALGIAPAPKDERKEIEMTKKFIVDKQSREGASINSLAFAFDYNEETKSVFQKAQNELKTAAAFGTTNSKEKIRLGFKGMIMRAEDVRKTKKQEGKSFGWQFYWVQAIFTNIDDPTEKLFIKGAVPFIQKHCVYQMDIYFEIDPKWGAQWLITKGRCRVIPPYHSKPDLVKLISLCATKDMTEESGIKQEKSKIAKSVSKFIDLTHGKRLETLRDDDEYNMSDEELINEKLDGSISQKSWLEWFRDDSPEGGMEWTKKMATAGVDLEWNQAGFSALTFPNIEKAYNGHLVLSKNTWWDSDLALHKKELWETQLHKPEEAFRMCFRATMPDQLRYECQTNEFDSMEDAPFIKEEEKLAVASKAKKLKREKLMDLMLELNHLDYINNLERNKHQRLCYIPEMTTAQFRALCTHRRWVEEYKPLKTLLEIPTVVSQLKLYLQCIDLYQCVKTFLDRDESKECAMLFDCVPGEYRNREALDYLVKLGVFGIREMQCKSFSHSRYHEACSCAGDGTQCHTLIFHRLWLDCNLALREKLNRFVAEKRNIKITPNELDPADLEKYDQYQKEIVHNVSMHPISCGFGIGGSGKSETAKLINQTYDGCWFFGFTGRSVDELAKRLGTDCTNTSTIHAWKLRSDARTHPIRVGVIDETSMISLRLFMQWFALVNPDRLVFFGDPMQLQSFSEYKGVLFRELIKIYPSVETRINYRLAKDPTNKILLNCQNIREGIPRLLFDHERFIWDMRSPDVRLNELIQEHVKTGFKSIAFLCGTNPLVHSVNYRCLKLLHAGKYPFRDSNSGIEKSQTFFINTFAIQDGIIFTSPTKRNEESDELDAYWNRWLYLQTKQTENTVKNLFRTRQQDRIVRIFRIRDGKSQDLLEFYKDAEWDFNEADASERDSDAESQDVSMIDMVEEICKQGKKHLFLEENENVGDLIPAPKVKKDFFDARDLKIPADYIEEVQFVTRADQVWDYTNLSQKDRYFKDFNTILVGESGRWFRLSDRFQHSMASTVSSYQGGEKDIIAFYNPVHSGFMENTFGRQFLYTTVSRTRLKFYYLGEKPQDMKSMILNHREDICCLGNLITEG